MNLKVALVAGLLGMLLVPCIAIAKDAVTQTKRDSKQVNPNPTWYAESRSFTLGKEGAFDEVAVKDPSIVFADGKYHMFYTGVTKKGEWQMGYASATTIEGLGKAEHVFFKRIREGYFCAPQVFYFEPQGKWYMIYNDGTYGAAYATTTDISKPDSWSGPKSLGLPNPTGYDFFVICDDEYAYVFYTVSGESRTVAWRRTPISKFPKGWSEPTIAATNTFEGTCVYKSLADGRYYLLVEDYKDNRHYGLWTSGSLSGPWTLINDKWASRRNLIDKGDHWTDNVSHGEILRAGINQKMEINDINKADFLIQGVVDGSYPEYVYIPWEIGLIRNYKK